MTAIIEVSDPDTWPEGLGQLVERESTGWAADDDIAWGLDGEARAELAAALRGVLVRAFHATRLLPHEEESIRADGLVRLDRNLQVSRVEQAFDHGHLTGEQAQRILRHGQRLINAEGPARVGQVCFCAGRDVLANCPGFTNLLCSWGGESLYGNLPRDSPDRLLVRSFGRPSMVVAGLDLGEPSAIAGYQWDGLLKALVRAHLGRGGAASEVFYERDVLGDSIEAIWHPGDAEFGPLEERCSEG